MKAKFKSPRSQNGRMMDGEKEQVAAMTVVAFRKGKFEEPVTARFWMARRSDGASPVYASVWVFGPRPADGSESVHLAGHGRANGYGYHKRSAALQAALSSAGVMLSERINGVGDGAMRDALSAVARTLGYRRFTIVEH